MCPDDGVALEFDPWSPTVHRCPRCGRALLASGTIAPGRGSQHLWLAERAATLAALAALTGHEGAGATGRRDSVAAMPSPISSIPTATTSSARAGCSSRPTSSRSGSRTTWPPPSLLRESGHLPTTGRRRGRPGGRGGQPDRRVRRGLLQPPDLAQRGAHGIAVWFEDEELLNRAVQSPTGMLAHLVRGVRRRRDVVRGRELPSVRAARGARWPGLGAAGRRGSAGGRPARQSAGRRAPGPGAHRAARPHLSGAQGLAFRPSRWRSRCTSSCGRSGSPALGDGAPTHGAGCRELYARSGADGADVRLLSSRGGRARAGRRERARISRGGRCSRWRPHFPTAVRRGRPGAVLLESQGLAVLRQGGRYASLECGRRGGGHGHPDRLSLTLYADGVHWLADPGTGSYVSGDLFWYRSTLAHNAPRLDGRSQPPADASCDAFDVQDGWGWARGRVRRDGAHTGGRPDYLLDVVELERRRGPHLELPWHLAGRVETVTPGDWTTGRLGRTVRRAGRAVHWIARRRRGAARATARAADADRSTCASTARCSAPASRAGLARRPRHDVPRPLARARGARSSPAHREHARRARSARARTAAT